MSKPFPYPLPAKHLREFCHPCDWHLFHEPRRYGGEVLVANGYVAIRARTGLWLDADHGAASADFVSRWGKLPWGRLDQLPDDWRELDGHRGTIYRSAQVHLWQDDRLAPTPVWAVNEVKVRLSLLQLVARLPRCEIYVGRPNADDPLWFRFSGGIGLIARDPRLSLHSYEIFGPQRDLWSGERVAKRGPRFQGVAHAGEMANWPPAEPVDL